MYAALWRTLPGPWPAKALAVLVLGGGVVALLFLVVFPWLEPRLPFNDSTVDEVSSSTTGPSSPPGSTSSPAATASPDASAPAATGEGGLSAPSVVASPSASLPG